jgi:hypothetical protein
MRFVSPLILILLIAVADNIEKALDRFFCQFNTTDRPDFAHLRRQDDRTVERAKHAVSTYSGPTGFVGA